MIAIEAPRPEQRRDWRRALAALRKLLADSEDTGQVFEIMRALNNGSIRKGYLRLLDAPGGARLAYEHVELAPKLMDGEWLEGFADGTVGAAYRDFVTREALSAEGLATISRIGAAAWIDSADPLAWYGRRVRDTHDLWHVLTGYGRDPLGEASLVAFSYSQTKGLGWLLIALGAWVTRGGAAKGVRAAIREGFRNGRRARWLPGIDYEALMRMPLAEAREALSIGAPTRYRAVIARLTQEQRAA